MTFDCPILFESNKTLDDYLSNSNIIYLEFLQPSSDYDDNYHQFKLFFTTFIPKLHIGFNDDLLICPVEHQIDCDDLYCVHSTARCNGIYECRSKIDEESCRSNGRIRLSHLSYRIIVIFILISML